MNCPLFLTATRNAVKTKKIAGIDLPSSSFAYVGDSENPATWKLPFFFRGNEALTRNHLKNALHRFADTAIPESERAYVWRMIAGAAKAHGIRVGRQTASSAPGTKRPYTAQPLDALDMELREARALGSLYADRLLDKISLEWE